MSAAHSPLLKTKLFMPRLRPGTLARPRLTAKLSSEALPGLILISAPAGFGKSTLITQWHASLPEERRAPLAWLSLDPADQDPVRFWLHALTALEGALPGVAGEALAMLRAAPPPPIEVVLATLVNALADLNEEAFLVLDDYHLIEAEAVHTGVRYLLEHLPPHLHLVFLTRTDPPLPLARMRARGELLELRAHELRFSEEEACELLGLLPGIELAPELVTALAARTEGWVAGLQLAALSLQGRADASGFVEAFVSSHHYLVDYLVEEILLRQPEPVQQFLLSTSILERLCAPLCEAVSGITGARAILEMLEQRGLFTLALDSERQWFRYHHLFADILRAHLEYAHSERVAELYRKAAAWYEANGMAPDAVRAAIAAADFEYAANLLEGAAEQLWQEGQSETLRTLLAAIPASVLSSRPHLLIQSARIRLLVDADLGAKELVAEAKAQLNDGAPFLAAKLATLEGAIARTEGDVERAISLCQEALATLPADESFWWPVAGFILALAYQQAGNPEAALPILYEGCQRSRKGGDLFTALIQYSILGNLQAALGQLRQAHDSFQAALRMASESGGHVRSIGLIHAGLGTVLYEWGQVEPGREALQRGLALGERYGHFDSTWRAQRALTNLYLMQGAPTPIREENLLGFMSSAKSAPPIAVAASQAQLAHLHLLEGNLGEAVRLCDLVGEVLENGLSSTWPESLVPVRVKLATGQTAEAAALLKRRLESGQIEGAVDTQIHTLSLLAVVLESAGDRAGALGALQQALALGEEARYVRSFLDEGPLMLLLLREAASSGSAYARHLLDLTGGAPAVSAPPRPVLTAAAGALVEGLSERELEVLRLAATGLTNQEIGAAIYITAGTVKNHLHNIIGKLGVSNRMQAINRARELGWL